MSLETKADQLAVVLEEEIVAGVISPGTVLRQEHLSERFAVSRTPVREALGRLAAQELVTLVANRGARVRELSHDQLWEAFLVRAELESLATELAASRMTPADLSELEAARRRFSRLTQELRAREPGRDRRELTFAWVKANHGFHDIIYRVAGAPMIERMAKSARRTFSGPAVWAPGDEAIDDLYEQNDQQHRAILEALRAGSATGARAVARDHVLASFHMLDVILSHVAPAPARRRRRRSKAG
jgi:DNA-binding GntR family transcriptional regulator